MSEGLTVAANHLLGVDPFLKVISAVAIVFMSVALVGLATGLGARYPRFAADNSSQVAGSYGGVAFMVMAVLLLLVINYWWSIYLGVSGLGQTGNAAEFGLILVPPILLFLTTASVLPNFDSTSEWDMGRR